MVEVEIDGVTAPLDQAVSGGWITEQLKRRRRDNRDPCVRVSIDEHGIHLALQTLSCQGANGGARRANRQEMEVLTLWTRHQLDQATFSPGDLQAFLRQLSQMLP